MKKILNIFLLLIIIFFTFNIYKHYSSNKNIKSMNYNRLNIDQILLDKISKLPVLPNDTNNVIVFNNSINEDADNEKKRSFWDLLQNK